MSRFSQSDSAAAGADPQRWKNGGLPDDVEALKALVIELHGRTLAQEQHIEQQREGLRMLARHIEGLRKLPCEQLVDLRIDGQEDEARLLPHSDNGRNGSG